MVVGVPAPRHLMPAMRGHHKKLSQNVVGSFDVLRNDLESVRMQVLFLGIAKGNI